MLPSRTKSQRPTNTLPTSVNMTCSKLAELLLSALIMLASCSLPVDAHAAPPREPGQLDGGAYIHISPGPLAVVIDEHKFSREARWAWPWSLGAGWMFARGPTFKATVGAAFEHRVLVLEHVTPHSLHALVESRIGAGNNRVWGYGLLGVGGASIFLSWSENAGADYHGVLFQFGGGVQGLIGRRFFIGGEFDFDVGRYFWIYEDNSRWDPFYYQTMTIELVLGWYF